MANEYFFDVELVIVRNGESFPVVTLSYDDFSEANKKYRELLELFKNESYNHGVYIVMLWKHEKENGEPIACINYFRGGQELK